METFIIYISKSALLISLFFLVYLLLLKRDTSFRLNRLFLLAGIFISVSLPALEYTRLVTVEASLAAYNFREISLEESVPVSTTGSALNWWLVATLFYLSGMAFLVLRMFFQLFSLALFLRKAERLESNGHTFYITDMEVQPFSFFHYIVYNKALHGQQELELILRHEKAHVRQWHSVDVLAGHLATCILWFNPLVWIYKKYLLQNLEYLADRETVAASGCKKEYQQALVRATTGRFNPVLANNFYQSLIKKRIIMLNKQATSGNRFWKAGLVLPLLFAFFLGFQVKTKAQIAATTTQENKNIGDDEFAVTLSSKTSEETLDALSRLYKARGINLSFDAVVRNTEGLITNIQISFRNTNNGRAGNYNQSNSAGIQPVRFYSRANGETGFETVEEPATTTAANEESLEIIKNRHVLIVLGDRVYEMETLYDKYIHLTGQIEVLNPEAAQKRFGKTGKDGALVIPEGKLVDNLDAAMRSIDGTGAGANEDYLHISKKLGAVLVNVNKTASNSKAETNNKFGGATYEKSQPDSLSFIEKYNKSKLFSGIDIPAVQFESPNAAYRSVLYIQEQKPLYVVDGKVQPEDFKPATLDPENIESITVLKRENPTNKYGEKGKNGVIEIKLKKEGDAPTKEKDNGAPEKNLRYEANKITFKTARDSASGKANEGSSISITGVANATVSQQSSSLYVLNGKLMGSDFDASTLKPKNIDSIVVLKGDRAVEKYGEKAAEGVIEINTKK